MIFIGKLHFHVAVRLVHVFVTFYCCARFRSCMFHRSFSIFSHGKIDLKCGMIYDTGWLVFMPILVLLAQQLYKEYHAAYHTTYE